MDTEGQGQNGSEALDELFTSPLMPRRVERYQVMESELESLGAGAPSVHVGLSAAALTAALAEGIDLLTGQISLSWPAVVSVAVVLVGVLLGLYFGYRAYLDRKNALEVVSRIKGQPYR